MDTDVKGRITEAWRIHFFVDRCSKCYINGIFHMCPIGMKLHHQYDEINRGQQPGKD